MSISLGVQCDGQKTPHRNKLTKDYTYCTLQGKNVKMYFTNQNCDDNTKQYATKSVFETLYRFHIEIQ